MTLLYLLDECVAVDEDGCEWVIDDKGAWQRGAERKPPRLLAVKNDDRADAPAPGAEAQRGAGSESTPFGRSGGARGVVQASR